MRSLVKACVFVDWHNAESNARVFLSTHRERYFQNVIFRIQDEVAKILKRRDSTVRYRAALRVYHGWHNEDRPTASRSKFEQLNQSESFGRTIGLVSFAPEIKFGNELACDTPRNPLFNTSRAQGQKMVDTAMACDLLYMLRTGAAAVGIIVSDDDDFVPAVFTAEAWGLESMLLRTGGHTIDAVSKVAAARLVCYWGNYD
jgi:uncharacterized LabA/DUF88 family protein